jgi:FG-GAP-like repeat/Abnormal spindle-like microcephaly-assoc'd, ASPM-SPD-2-Hydin
VFLPRTSLWKNLTGGLAVVPCALLLGASALAQFETRGTFGSSPQPSSIAVGDYNHDGKLDLAVAGGGSNTNTLTILLGNGDGTFRLAGQYTVGVGAVSVVAADFNHDGNLDLAVASQSSYIAILMGNGDGTFQPPTQSPPVPTFEDYVMVGDFNGDGTPDLIVLSSNNPCKCISVLLGNGDGSFQNAVVTQPPFSVTALGVGDFDRDGKLDVATAGSFGSGGNVNVLLGNGDGTFRYGAHYPGGSVPVSIAVADFRGDHKLDLAIADAEGIGISVLLGNGDGTFQKAVNYPTLFPNWVTVADVNGDHKLDLVAANYDFPSGASVFLGNGDGTFRPGGFYSAGEEVSYLAPGDFNGDRKIDLVLANYRNENVVVLLNTGVASFSPSTPLNFKTQAVGTTSAPRILTLTNTGLADLTIASMKARGQFGMTSTCGSSVAPGANCSISVTFSPQTQGPKYGSITINDSASSKPQVIELAGTGT